MKIIITYYVLVLLLFFSVFAVKAAILSDWDSLFEEDKQYFGSEKEQKFPINAFIVEKEKWQDHSSLMIFWLFKNTNYPKYTSIRILPFYYNISSKVDDRSITAFPILLFYYETFNQQSVLLNPVLSFGNDLRFAENNNYNWNMSLLHYYSKEKSHYVNETIFFAPIIPLPYHRVSDTGGHRNYLWFIDYEWEKKNNIDNLQRLVVFPFFATWNNQTKEYSSRTMLTPFYCNTVMSAADNVSESYWWPVLPLYFYSSDKNGSHTNTCFIFDWEKDRSDRITNFNIYPLVFHDTSEGGGRYYLPFYLRPEGWTQKTGYSMGLFYFHNWDLDETTFWFGPRYYYKNDTAKTEADLWAPFYYKYEDIKSRTELFLPLYFETADKDKSYLLKINITGISQKFESGLVSSLNDKGVVMSRGLYVDTDMSWLYDMISVSTRTTVINTGDEPRKENNGKDKVIISDNNNVSRDNSKYFWGLTLFYGLSALEYADSKRHFRILPLSWITWDTESSDEIKWILNYLSYKRDSTEYFVFFPFYGRQIYKASWRKGYFFNLYWDEYDDSEKMREKTILWPLINWYEKPGEVGWRVFPVIWSKQYSGSNEKSNSYISPLFYYNKSQSINNNNYNMQSFSLLHWFSAFSNENSIEEYYATLIPLIGYENITNQKKETLENKDQLLTDNTRWAFPVFYYHDTNLYFHYNMLVIVDYEKSKITGLSEKWLVPLYFSKTGDAGYFHIVPLYLSWWNYNLNEKSKFIFGYYYCDEPKYKRRNFLHLYDHVSDENIASDKYSYLLTMVQKEKTQGSDDFHILHGLLYDSTVQRNTGYYNYSALIYLASLQKDKDSFHNRFLPLWYYESFKNGYTIIIPALLSGSVKTAVSETSLYGLGLLYLNYFNKDENSKITAYLSGILFYSEAGKKERGYVKKGSLWGLLWENEYETNTGFKKFSLFKFLYKRIEMNGKVIHKILGISL